MTTIDELADRHVSRLDIPPGTGVDEVMRNGKQRRQRRRAAGVGAATACTITIAGLAIVAIAGERDDATLVEVGATETAFAERSDVDVAIDTDTLPARDDSQLPLVPTPTLQGWTVDSVGVAVADRSSTDGVGMALYSLRSGSSQVRLDVSSGQVDLSNQLLTLDRDGRTVDASIDRADNGVWTLVWNERPGNNAGTAVSLVGSDRPELIEIATALVLVDAPLIGAADPTFVAPDPSVETVFRGTIGNVVWSVGRSSDGAARIDIDGRSPAIMSTVTELGPEISTTTISKDGVQITTIEVPADARSVSIASRGAEPIPLPMQRLADTGRQLAVAPIPSHRDAPVISVRFETVSCPPARSRPC